jgi:hypothetical protein
MRFWLAFLMLISLALAGCAQSSGTANDDNRNRFGGFYGGVSGGGMGP